MKKYKNIIGTLVFLLIGFVIFVNVSYLFRPMDATFRRARVTGFYGEEDETLDVVTIGSSAVYRYFNNPYLWKTFGITSYNFATPQQPITIFENVIDEAEKTQSPKLFIVETRGFNQEEGYPYDESRLKVVTDNMKYSVNRIKTINKHIDGWDNRLAAYFDIISYHDTWEQLDEESVEFMDNEQKHPLKGWSINTKVKAQKEPRVPTTETLPISEEAEQILRELLTKCKEENIPVLFVSTPYRMKIGEQERNNTIAGIVAEYGFEFLDCNLYNEQIGLNYQTDFYNRLHTNVIGAEKVTHFIGDYITKNYDVSTEHTKSTKKEWDQVVRKYDERLADKRELLIQGISVENNQDEDADDDE